MKKITKNLLSFNDLKRLSHLLNQGYLLQDALVLLKETNNQVFHEIIIELQEGELIENVLCQSIKDSFFVDLFRCLYPIKGLSLAIDDAYQFYLEKQKWLSLLKKQMAYPFGLVVVMMLFSSFVKMFLLPEVESLYESFAMTSQTSSLKQLAFIQLIPNVLMIITLLFVLCSYQVIIVVRKHELKEVLSILKIPFVSIIVKTYYSLKFAFYFSKISSYFDNFYDAIHYFNDTNQKTDLSIVINHLSYALNDGIELQKIIHTCPFFISSFQQFFYYLSSTQQNFKGLEDYCEITFQNIEQYLKLFSKVVMILIYGCTGIYIMSLYSLMILPILEITSTL